MTRDGPIQNYTYRFSLTCQGGDLDVFKIKTKTHRLTNTSRDSTLEVYLGTGDCLIARFYDLSSIREKGMRVDIFQGNKSGVATDSQLFLKTTGIISSLLLDSGYTIKKTFSQ